MKKILATIAVIFSLISAGSVLLLPTSVFATTTASVNSITYGRDGKSASFDIYLSDAASFKSTMRLKCIDPQNNPIINDASALSSGTEFIATCSGLTPSTTYSYLVYPVDVSFATVKGTFTTPVGTTTPTGGESYNIVNTPDVEKGTDSVTRVSISVDVKNPILSRNYILELGTLSNNVCTPNPAYTANPSSSPNNDMVITDTWTPAVGSYCTVVEKQNDNDNNYSIVVPNLSGGTFTISDGTVTPTGGAATLSGPNAYGCTSTGTTSYCMLAPIPIPDSTGKIDATGKVDVTQGFGNYINGIIKLVMGIIGVLAVLMVVVGGIEYMSTVSIGEKEGAKNRIVNALLGLVLALGSYVILNTINPSLVNVTVTVPSANLTVDVDTFTPTSGGGSAVGGGSSPNVTANISTYDQFLKTSSARYGVDCTLLKAFMYAESGGNPNASSSVGAGGLIQLMPATFTGLGYNISQINDPATNIDAGAKYISQLQGTACNGGTSNTVCNVSDKQYVIAAYNAGPKGNGLSTVCQKGQSINTTAWQCTLNSGYAQTRNYVPRVLGNYNTLSSTAGWGC